MTSNIRRFVVSPHFTTSHRIRAHPPCASISKTTSKTRKPHPRTPHPHPPPSPVPSHPKCYPKCPPPNLIEQILNRTPAKRRCIQRISTMQVATSARHPTNRRGSRRRANTTTGSSATITMPQLLLLQAPFGRFASRILPTCLRPLIGRHVHSLLAFPLRVQFLPLGLLVRGQILTPETLLLRLYLPSPRRQVVVARRASRPVRRRRPVTRALATAR